MNGVHQDASTSARNKFICMCIVLALAHHPFQAHRPSQLGARTGAAMAAMRSPPGGGAGGDPRQLWVGNIPQGLQAWEVVEVMELYGVRPYKLVLRSRRQLGQDDYNTQCSTSVRLNTSRSKQPCATHCFIKSDAVVYMLIVKAKL